MGNNQKIGRPRSPLTHCYRKRRPQIIPGLRASFWDPDQFEWIKKLRCAFPKIREKCSRRSSSMQKESGFQPYRAPSSTKKDKQGSGTTRGTAAHDVVSGISTICTCTTSTFLQIRESSRNGETVEIDSRFYDHAMFSNLASTTHVTKHHGPTNKSYAFIFLCTYRGKEFMQTTSRRRDSLP